jgi:fatty acid desaturase
MRGTVRARHDHLTATHGALNVVHVIGSHALLVAWLLVGFELLPLVAYIPLSACACLIHQRAMSEWVHEGAHFNLVPNRRWNDRLTNLLAGIWFALPVRVYRDVHFAHHRKSEFFVPDDPDTAFLGVDSRRSFWSGVLSDLTGLTILRQFLRFEVNEHKASQRGALVLSAVANGAILVGSYQVGNLYAPLIYYVSLATLYPLLNRLRTYGQHVTVDGAGRSQFAGSGTSRTIDAGLLDRIFYTSPRLMYHHEHHLSPYLPYRALRHAALPDDDRNRYTRSRWAVMRSIYLGLPPRAA